MCTRESIKNDVLQAVQHATNVTINPKSPKVEELRLEEDLGILPPARRNLSASFHKVSRRCGGPAIGPGTTGKLKTIKACIELIANKATCKP